MKRAFCLLFALLLCLSLFSCAYQPENRDETWTGGGADGPEDIKVESTVPSGTKNYGIVADSIRAYYSPDVDYEVFILERDGKFGVIDHKGTVLVEPKFDFATLAHTAKNDSEWQDAEIKILLSNKTEHGSASMEGFFVEADGTLTAGSYGGFGYASCLVYWDSTKNEPALFVENDGVCEYRGNHLEDYFSSPVFHTYFASKRLEKERMIPVQAISAYEITSTYDAEHLKVTTEQNGRYALLSLETGKLLTDFVYEDYDRQGEVNRAIAMKKNGSWGYVDTIGREITRFGFLPCYTEKVWGKNGWEEVAAFYPNTRSNLITFCEGELYGILEASEGRIYVIPAYTDISMPNTSGWFYAKVADGTWTAVNAFENYKK